MSVLASVFSWPGASANTRHASVRAVVTAVPHESKRGEQASSSPQNLQSLCRSLNPHPNERFDQPAAVNARSNGGKPIDFDISSLPTKLRTHNPFNGHKRGIGVKSHRALCRQLPPKKSNVNVAAERFPYDRARLHPKHLPRWPLNVDLDELPLHIHPGLSMENDILHFLRGCHAFDRN